MSGNRVRPTNCLGCGKALDGATGIGGGEPYPGCLSICVYYGAVTMFGDDMRLRPLTDAEIGEIRADRETWRLLARATRLIHFFQAGKN